MNQSTSEAGRFDVLIDLEQGDSAKALLPNELVQRRHYELLKKQICIHLGDLQSRKLNEQGSYPNSSGWTQFIDGSRGAGKSTFLSSVKRALKGDKAINHQMAFIEVIDPSRIEHSEIVLLVILQHLRKHVDEALKQQRQREDEHLRDDWRRAFKGVAGGLSLFAKDYHPLSDLDPELFLDWGLERTSDSTSLRSKLHHLFDIACGILGVHALMLGFDDADTDATHAIHLLECIRKYLDTPRVMVLVTGDMELYSLLVRQHFALTVAGKREAALDLQRSAKQGDRSGQYLRMVDHLEEQYLLKLFPIRRRMQLQPLWNVKLRDNCQLTHPAWGGEKYSVEEVLHVIVRRGLRVKTKSDVDMYTEFLLKQPLRSVLQVMASCAPLLDGSSSADLTSLAWSDDLTTALGRSLQALALTSLYKHSVDTDAIAAKELPALTQGVFDLSLEDGDLDTAPYLRPMSAEPDIKACFAALAAEVPNFCAKKPGTALRYLLRGPGSVSLYALARDYLKDRDQAPSLDRVYQFKSYLGIGRREDSLDWARRATAVIAQPYSINYRLRVVLPGVIGLRGNNKGRRSELAARTVIQKAVADPAVRRLPVFALSMVNVASGINPRTYGSIFTLLGLIEKLLSADAQDEQDTHTLFERASPSLTVSAPSWSTQARSAADDQQDAGAQPTADSKNLHKATDERALKDALWQSINVWRGSVRDLHEKSFPSAIFLGKVWTRLFYSLQNAAADLKASADFATVMEIFALCVINAFLVEEADHHLLGSSDGLIANSRVDRNNPRTSASWFVDKLVSVKPQRDEFPLTSIIATCPLLLGLLDSEKGYAKALKPLFPDGTNEAAIEDLLCPKELVELMRKVSVTGEPRIRTTGKGEKTGEDDAGTKQDDET